MEKEVSNAAGALLFCKLRVSEVGFQELLKMCQSLREFKQVSVEESVAPQSVSVGHLLAPTEVSLTLQAPLKLLWKQVEASVKLEVEEAWRQLHQLLLLCSTSCLPLSLAGNKAV